HEAGDPIPVVLDRHVDHAHGDERENHQTPEHGDQHDAAGRLGTKRDGWVSKHVRCLHGRPMVMLQRRSEDEKVTSTDVYATSPNIWVPMVTILGHNSLDRAFPNIQALGGAQCGIPGRYFLRVLPLLI